MTQIYTETLQDGWVQLPRSINYLTRYWLDPFPLARTEEEQARSPMSTDGPRVSPIMTYRNGGIGKWQWFNATHDKAAILCLDGGWESGGQFHLWYSAGAGSLPFELPWDNQFKVTAGNFGDWESEVHDARRYAVALLGLRRCEELTSD